MHLSSISSPKDLKVLQRDQLPALCTEIRQVLLEHISTVGGHLASNLGAVELSVAVHRVFDSPRDKIVFDVSHQTYTHKMLTGRAQAFLDARHYQDVSGFTNPEESEHDLFALGHTSTSISLCCGLAQARDLAGEHYNVVAIIGDGSLSSGLAFEGLDAAADIDSNLIIIINDNDQSIAENHGGLYRGLSHLRASAGAAPDNLFRAMGLDYRYLEAGNDVLALVDALEDLRDIDHPIVLHVHTTKGLGYEPAQRDPEAWHHVGPFDLATGTKRTAPQQDNAPRATYAELTGAHLLDRMKTDRRVVGVSAATPYVMGFGPQRRREAGAQFIDVGIAEQHAVTLITALARAGAKPVLGIYGTFLQRAYDELWHDLCLSGVAATILSFGASVYGTNDQTHLSFFDLSMLGNLPGLRILCPVCVEEYLAMIDWALDRAERPTVIRVPGGPMRSLPDFALQQKTSYDTVRYETVRRGSQVAILALGSFYALGENVADTLSARGIHPTLINPRFASELDTQTLDELASSHRCIVTLEDGVLEGGWGEKIARYLGCSDARVRCYGLPKSFPDRYRPEDLLASCGVTAPDIAGDISQLLDTTCPKPM